MMNRLSRVCSLTTSLPGVDMAAALAPPKGFNPHAVDFWFTACKNLPKDTRLAKVKAMHRYVRLCDSAGLSPFTDSNPNAAIRNFLGNRRRLYVRFADITGFMQNVRVRKVSQTADLTDYGFSIKVEAWVQVPDPLWFRVTQKPGWRFSLAWDKEHRYTLKLDPGITVYVRNPSIRNPNSWYVGYEVHCPITPVLPVLTPNMILEYLWTPTSAKFRPKRTLPQRRI